MKKNKFKLQIKHIKQIFYRFFLLTSHFSLFTILISCSIPNTTETTLISAIKTDSNIKIGSFEIKDFGFRDNIHGDDEDDDEKDFKDFNEEDRKYEKEWNYEHKPTLKINDVLFEGKSVLKNGTGEIKADFGKDKDVELTLKGVFKTWKPIRLKDMTFRYENGLYQQSIVGNRPMVRVLLDDSIIFTPISVSENEIKVKLNTKYILEGYLKGNHKLTLEARKYFTDTLIKVGDPEPVSNLMPKITKVEVLKDKKNKPVNLRLTGSNFMMYYRFSYSTIDGVFGFGHQTNILTDGTFETIVHIPKPELFDLSKKHTISYATPFGVTFKEF
ncbi:MAG: hypothetical protein U0457_16730 [Candidatus Sericytochromatia bacterium]